MDNTKSVEIKSIAPDTLTTIVFGHGNSGGHRVSGGGEPPKTHSDRESAVRDAAKRLRRDK